MASRAAVAKLQPLAAGNRCPGPLVAGCRLPRSVAARAQERSAAVGAVAVALGVHQGCRLRAVRRHACTAVRSAAGTADDEILRRTDLDVVEVSLQICFPALLCGAAASLCFCPCALALRSFLAEATRAVLKDDMTQFSQNAFAVAVLIFGLLLGETLSMLIQRQDRLYRALYKEVSEARALMEQLLLMGGQRFSEWNGSSITLLDSLEAYLLQDLQTLGRPSLLHPAGSVDPLEELMFVTSVGTPSAAYSSVQTLRQLRAERLAAAQRKYPAGHIAIICALGAVVLAIFILLAAGMAGFEAAGEAALPGHLLAVLAPLFGLLVTAFVLAALFLRELAALGDSRVFRVQDALEQGLGGLLADLRLKRQKTQMEPNKGRAGSK